MPRIPKGGAKVATTGGLAVRAFGPAASEFGQEIGPLGKEAGQATVKAVRATVRSVQGLLKPLSGLVWGFERVRGWVSEEVASRMEAVPTDRRIEPSLMVAGPLLEAMKYCGSEPHLRDLFANLLVTSMDVETVTNAHPAFVEMLRQLSPDEAKLLTSIAGTFHQSYGVIYVHRAWEALKMNTTTGETETRTAEVFGPYAALGRYAGCEHLALLPTYITNLVRLQIISLHVPSPILPEELNDLESDAVIQKKGAEIEAFGHRVIHRTGFVETTPLGRQFIDACVRRRFS